MAFRHIWGLSFEIALSADWHLEHRREQKCEIDLPGGPSPGSEYMLAARSRFGLAIIRWLGKPGQRLWQRRIRFPLQFGTRYHLGRFPPQPAIRHCRDPEEVGQALRPDQLPVVSI
jgi:hypothetical protein